MLKNEEVREAHEDAHATLDSAMNHCEDTEDGVPPSKTTVCGGPERQTKDQRMKEQRPDSAEPSCGSMILSSQSSSLRELDLSNNDLQDSGVKLLSARLKQQHYRLETLSLSGCLITEEGCASLASALSSNPSHLRELDLSYNHPGESGGKLLSAGLEDPHWRLDTLRLDHSGLERVKRKYACELELDPNTVNKNLQLSDNNRKRMLGVEDGESVFCFFCGNL
ncbi:hypothetical protein Q5P01_018877 [Channa striata]|uniref:Uncharacterized protein n=1 Tax=Channa striata TaxID=64152 RepID=A0AA88S9Q5_CHASR|nr:hypothetical protein Q5P01_018877 [Channa striata]